MTEEQLNKLLNWLKEEEGYLLDVAKSCSSQQSKDYFMGRASQLRIVINHIHQLLQDE